LEITIVSLLFNGMSILATRLMDNPLQVSSSSLMAASKEDTDDSITMTFLIKQMQYLTCAKGSGPAEARSLEHLFPIGASVVSSPPSVCGGRSEMQCDPNPGIGKEKSPSSYNELELEQAKQRAIKGLRGNFVKIL
jgi:hypothetical protein